MYSGGRDVEVWDPWTLRRPLKCQKMDRLALVVGVLMLTVCTCASDITNSSGNVCNNVEIWNKWSSTCRCHSSRGLNVKIVCDNSVDFDGLQVNGTDINTLEISNVAMNVLSKKAVINVKLNKLILRSVHSYWMFLLWRRDFLWQSQETLEMLEIYSCTSIFSWDLDYIGEMKRLTHLVIVDSPLYYIYFEFSNFEALEYLELCDVELSSVHEKEFSQLWNLRLLSLSGNKIKKLERNMFPRPAGHLWHLDFSYNVLQELPPDIFSDMELLKEVRLDHNRLKSLPEKIFDAISLPLKVLWLHDNSLDCEKESGWMKRRGLPAYTWKAQCLVQHPTRN